MRITRGPNLVVSDIPKEVLLAYAHLGAPLAIDPIEMGLINKTYSVTTKELRFILQELSPIFSTAVIDDSQAVAQHLAKKGIFAPHHLKTMDDNLFLVLEGRLFRALTYIAGGSSHFVTSLLMAESAGYVLGRFHCALADFNYDYKNRRHHGGDYLYHKNLLIRALKEHEEHLYFNRVLPQANLMIEHMDALTKNLTTTARHVHGDPKISNIIFNDQNEAMCLVDFDTLGKTGWSLEIADALRSWCNPNKEDVLDSHVDLSIAESALRGYGAVMKGQISTHEVEELRIHAEAITLCLAMRYLADVLNEKYWAYDQKRFARAAEHNWLRASAMFSLFYDFKKKRHHLADLIETFLI